MRHQLRISAKYREEPDYEKLARALLSIAERLLAEEGGQAPSDAADDPAGVTKPQAVESSEAAS
jgi:hypothetical protein